MKKLLLAGAALLLLVMAGVSARPALPGDSVYQLPVELSNQDGQVQSMAARRGRPQLVTMFYTSCTMVCPMIVETVEKTRRTLDAPAQQRFDILAVSFDPQRDDTAALRKYAATRKLDLQRWTLAHTTPTATRQLAALLGIQYRQLPDGEFNHSSELILLDADGRIVARTDVIGRLDPAFVAALHRQVAAEPPPGKP
ncbi:MAG: SCO family protein [Xanthomonadales bacterium]|nr:SCO family protein [Xanthomonadales bacterium]